jgi:guanylate kinase
MVLIGCTGSGTTFLSRYVAGNFDDFVICKKVTTREKRTNEATGAAYYFVDEATFHNLLVSGRLVHVKFSDFDNAKYGIEEAELTGIVQRGRSPILTCHSVEEAQTLKQFLHTQGIAAVCIYIYASEQDRKRALVRSGETGKHLARYYMDVAFKIQVYQKRFADCNYIVANRYDSQATEQIRMIVNAVRSGNVAAECDIGIIHESLDTEIQEMLRRHRFTASEL